jgi:hypothetical protein
MGDFESDLREQLQRLVSIEEPSKESWEGIEAQLRGSGGMGRPGNGARAMAALAFALSLVVAGSVVVSRQMSDDGQRVATGPSDTSPGPAPGPIAGADGARHPATTTVMTANATATAGLATATLQLLQASGYLGTRAIDAFGPSDTSRVYFAPGYEAEAQAVARLLGLPESAVDPTLAPVAQPTSANLVVVIGQDLVGMRPTGPPTTLADLPPPLTRGPARATPSIATGTSSDGRSWSLSIGGPSNDLCFGVELAQGSSSHPTSCAGSPGGFPPTDPYRPLFHNELRTPPFVFGRMPSGTVAIEVVASVSVAGRVPVIDGVGGPFYAVELPDRTKPEAVIGYRADGTSERYAVPG